MDNLNDLKRIWRTANTDGLPGSDEIMRMGRRFRNERLRKKIFLIIAAFLLTGLMFCVVFFYKSTMLTTRAGEAFIIFAGCILAYTNIKSIGRFYRYKDYSNKEFVGFLEQTRRNQIRYYKKTQVAGLAFCSAGSLLYMFEFTAGDFFTGIVCYSLLVVFLLLLWLVIRPRSFKKQMQEMNRKMEKLKELSDQL